MPKVPEPAGSPGPRETAIAPKTPGAFGTSGGDGTTGILARAWLCLERVGARSIGPELNPFHYLGAIGIYFLWVILITGLYLLLFYSITADGAYDSIEHLTRDQWYLGGVMRSMHRYASDGLVIVFVLHALRHFALQRHANWRWIAWVTGVIAAWIVWAGGIFGYWLVWDTKAQLIALLSSEMIDAVPLLGPSLGINFARPENLADNFFYIVLFVHFCSIAAIALLLLLHVARITRAVITPPRAMLYVLTFVLLVFSLIKPALSTGKADLSVLPGPVELDWFYLFIYPALKAMPAPSAPMLWAFLAATTLIIAAVPWIVRPKRYPPAEVIKPACTGCELCYHDCPYMAIRMEQLPGPIPGLIARVLPQRCASCGICTGSCDFDAIAPPNLSAEDLKKSVRALCTELKEWTIIKGITGVKGIKEVKGAIAPAEAPVTVLALLCTHGAPLSEPGGGLGAFAGVRVLRVPCIGMVHPSLPALALTHGVSGVFIAGCAPGDCAFRFGNTWFEERLRGRRMPQLTAPFGPSEVQASSRRIKAVYLSAVEGGVLVTELLAFINSLRDLVGATATDAEGQGKGEKSGTKREAGEGAAGVAGEGAAGLQGSEDETGGGSR